MVQDALAQLPFDPTYRVGKKVLVRIDGAGGTHSLIEYLTKRRLSYSVGFSLTVLLDQAAKQVRNLELGKATYHIALDGCRAAARRVGAHLEQQGVVTDPEDVFFLMIEELRAPPAHVRELVAFRRQRRKEYEALEVPMTFYGVPEPVRATQSDNVAVRELTGIAASNGTAEGRARIIGSADEDEDLFLDGDILVCYSTNPSWTPLFTLVEAVVIDIGSTASHGAIVARELGIPCVINTGNGSRIIRNGDLIRVDGTTGIVTILERQ